MSHRNRAATGTHGRQGSNTHTPKRYEGRRSYGRVIVTVNGNALDPRFDLHNHSPNGFEWGYGGSGPAQLALALLADHLNDDSQALSLYQDFKRTVVAALAHDGWTLSETEIQLAILALRNSEKGEAA
jgi:hypothetical protein